MADFHALQAAFTAHLRDPAAVPAPAGIEERRLKIYRELFFNNVEGFLANAFPVLHRLLPAAHWQGMTRDFFARHRSHDPLFQSLAAGFLAYLEQERGTVAGDPPYLLELAHYEWVELALSVAEDELPPGNDADLLEGAPELSPLAWPLAYDYPVHRIGPDWQPSAPGPAPSYLVVYRNREDAVRFTEINAVTARLLELIQAQPSATGRQHLQQIAAELGAEVQTIVEAGRDMLQGLRAREVILGTRRS